MGSQASAPPPPDYAGAAKQTAAGNLENQRAATSANRVNTYTPYGSLTYSQDPSNPDKWTSNVALSPDQQSLLDQQTHTSQGLAGMTDAAMGRVGSAMGTQLPGAYGGSQQAGVYDPNAATNNASDLISARLAPQQERDSAALDNQLANQGLAPGSEAWNTAKDQMGRTQNDARQQAQLAGINLGQSQQAQQFGQQFQNAGQQQGQQAQSYSQGMNNINMPMNLLNALRTGSQVTNPTFSTSPQQGYVPGADMTGAASNTYNAQMQGVNAQNGNSGNFTNGLFSLGSAGIMAYAF